MASQRWQAVALFERNDFMTLEMHHAAYDERYEFDPVISELSSCVITIEVIWDGRV